MHMSHTSHVQAHAMMSAKENTCMIAPSSCLRAYIPFKASMHTSWQAVACHAAVNPKHHNRHSTLTALNSTCHIVMVRVADISLSCQPLQIPTPPTQLQVKEQSSTHAARNAGNQLRTVTVLCFETSNCWCTSCTPATPTTLRTPIEPY